MLTDQFRDQAVDVAEVEDGTVIGVRYRIRTDGEIRPASIAHAIVWKLRHVGDATSALAFNTGAPGRVSSCGPVDLGNETLRVSRDRDRYVVAFSDAFGDELLHHSAAAERRIGEMLAARLHGRRASDFLCLAERAGGHRRRRVGPSATCPDDRPVPAAARLPALRIRTA